LERGSKRELGSERKRERDADMKLNPNPNPNSNDNNNPDTSFRELERELSILEVEYAQWIRLFDSRMRERDDIKEGITMMYEYRLELGLNSHDPIFIRNIKPSL
jgi:hypothetical protein